MTATAATPRMGRPPKEAPDAPELVAEGRRTARRLADLDRRREEAITERDNAVRAMVAEGFSYAYCAALFGVKKARIGQIAGGS